jgi:hypothetical protein
MSKRKRIDNENSVQSEIIYTDQIQPYTPNQPITLPNVTYSGLSASQAVVTDASKNLASLQYTSNSTVSTLASRDSSGNSNFNNVRTSGGVSVSDGLTNNSTRPSISGGTTVSAYHIRAFSSSADSDDDGFLRLQAGGGTTTASISAIDLSGYSNVADMKENIVFYTQATERARFDSTGHLNVAGLTASEAVVTDSSKNLASLQYTSSNTASTLASRDVSGNSNFNQLTLASGLLLPTSGGTATSLTYYEEGSVTTTWNGPWSSNQNGNITFCRIGKKVTLFLPQVLATANNGNNISNVSALPSKLIPNAVQSFVVRVRDDATDKTGMVELDTSGFLTFGSDPGFDAFVGSGNTGFYATSLTYLVA